LKMAVCPYITKKFNSPRNKLIYIPVWGTFKGYVPPTFYEVTINDISYPTFLAEGTDPNTPDIFDGTSAGSVVDFNETPLITNIVANWNGLMAEITNMFSSLVSIGGDATGGPSLTNTRYCQFATVENSKREITGIVRVPKCMRKFVTEVEIVEDAPHGTLVRQSSKGGVVERKVRKVKYIAPPDSTIFNQFTLGYSSILPITETKKENYPQFILPVIEIVPGALPSIPQVQTATLEPYSLEFNSSTIFNNRATEIIAAGVNNVVGLAGRKTDLSSFTETLSNMGKGGFLGDMFATVGNLGTAIGIPEVGMVGNVAASIANSFGL